MKKFSFLFLPFLLLQVSVGFCQFLDKNKTVLNSCDCNTRLDEMYFQLPQVNTSGFDLIGIMVVSEKKSTVIAKEIYYVGDFRSRNGGVLNLLNPEELGGQAFWGMEGNLFQGKDINLSYSSLCQYNYDFNVVFKVVGITQVGTETEYYVEGNTLKSNSRKIYDSGTLIHKSEPMTVKSAKNNRDYLYAGLAIAAIPASRVVGFLVRGALLSITD